MVFWGQEDIISDIELLMKIYFLGTNGWYDNKIANTICTFIDSKEGYVILDAGDGIYKAEKLLTEKKPVYLFLSHLHLDHISGFHIFTCFDKRETHIILEKGNKELLENFVRHPYMNSLRNDVVFHEIEEGECDISFHIQCLKLKHMDPAVGYRISLEGKEISYCVDTSVCDNLKKLSENSDVLITECSMRPGISNPEWGHLNPEEAAGIAKDAAAKKLVLTHFSAEGYDTLEKREEAEIVANKIFPNTILAKDDLIIEL